MDLMNEFESRPTTNCLYVSHFCTNEEGTMFTESCLIGCRIRRPLRLIWVRWLNGHEAAARSVVNPSISFIGKCIEWVRNLSPSSTVSFGEMEPKPQVKLSEFMLPFSQAPTSRKCGRRWDSPHRVESFCSPEQSNPKRRPR
jgi:hypothetical protein